MAVVAGITAFVMLAVYLSLLQQQEESVPLWVVAVLVGGGALAVYGAWVPAPAARRALVAAGVLLTALGVLAILSIGVPILLAGLACLGAALRRGRTAH
jgi:hypothetical protein